MEFDFRRKYFEQFAYMFISYILWLDQWIYDEIQLLRAMHGQAW